MSSGSEEGHSPCKPLRPHGWLLINRTPATVPTTERTTASRPEKSSSLGHSEAPSVHPGWFSQLATSATSGPQLLVTLTQHHYGSPGYEPVSSISVPEKSSPAQRNLVTLELSHLLLWDFTGEISRLGKPDGLPSYTRVCTSTSMCQGLGPWGRGLRTLMTGITYPIPHPASPPRPTRSEPAGEGPGSEENADLDLHEQGQHRCG